MNYFSGSIEHVYSQIVEQLLQADKVGETRELRNTFIEIENPTLHKICFPKRKQISLSYAQHELEWYWSADNSCKTIGQYASMWNRISDDGVSSNSAYGYILHKKHNKDQLQEVIQELTRNKNSRKAVLILCDPTIDKLKTKDLQCTIAIQFLVRDDQLEETVYMRSNDVYFGFPYDYIYFVSIGQYISSKLNLKFSKYIHNATSMHMYDKDVDKFKYDTCQYFSIFADKIIEENYNV